MSTRLRKLTAAPTTLATLAAAAALLLAACAPAEEPREPERPDAPAAVANDVANERPVCLRGGPFVADGGLDVRDATPGDADRPGGLRWQRYEGCERFVVDLVDADGNPADRAGRVTAEVLRGLGVVRVELRDVERGDMDVTDAAFGGPLARGAFVVGSPDGRSKFVDLHLAEPAEAFVTTLDEPARVVVDLRPGGPRVPGPAPREGHVVVLAPRPGEVTYPITVTGYARTFEANVVVRLERDGEEVFEDFTTATGWLDAWGYYTLAIDDGPTGPLTLHVGEYSARDGTWQGVAVEIVARR